MAHPTEHRRRLHDYTPGMLANRAVAWWQARRIAKGNRPMREAWVERLGGWDNMTRSQKIATAAFDIGAATLIVSTLGRTSQMAGIDIADMNPWSGGGSYSSATAEAPPETLDRISNPEESTAYQHEYAVPHEPHSPDFDLAHHTAELPNIEPQIWAPPEMAARDLTLAYPETAISENDRSCMHECPPVEFESRVIGAFNGCINPVTGYYYGTAYNTIALELIDQNVNPRQDIPDQDYHAMVGQVLSDNGWTWESARRSMQPGDTLTIDRSIFEAYLPPPPEEAPPEPPPEPTPPPEPPPPAPPEQPDDNDYIEFNDVALPAWLAAGGAAVVGGIIGYAIGNRLYAAKRRRDAEAERKAAEEAETIKRLGHEDTEIKPVPVPILTPEKEAAKEAREKWQARKAEEEAARTAAAREILHELFPRDDIAAALKTAKTFHPTITLPEHMQALLRAQQDAQKKQEEEEAEKEEPETQKARHKKRVLDEEPEPKPFDPREPFRGGPLPSTAPPPEPTPEKPREEGPGEPPETAPKQIAKEEAVFQTEHKPKHQGTTPLTFNPKITLPVKEAEPKPGTELETRETPEEKKKEEEQKQKPQQEQPQTTDKKKRKKKKHKQKRTEAAPTTPATSVPTDDTSHIVVEFPDGSRVEATNAATSIIMAWPARKRETGE